MSAAPSQGHTATPHEPTIEAAQGTAPSASQLADAVGLTEADLKLLTAALPTVERLYERLKSISLILHLRPGSKGEGLTNDEIKQPHDMIDAGFSAPEIAAHLSVTTPAVYSHR